MGPRRGLGDWTTAAIWATALGDGITTYVVLATGAGIEANPEFSLLNHNPYAALPLGFLIASVVYIIYIALKWLGIRPWAIYTVVAWRALAVINNLFVLFFGLSFAYTLLAFTPYIWATASALLAYSITIWYRQGVATPKSVT